MSPYLITIPVLLFFMTSIFCLALFLKDNSIVDIAYGSAFVLISWSAYLSSGSAHPRQLLVLSLVTLWGLRLSAHIFLRKRGESGEDSRYRKWRDEWGDSFVWRSFLQIFMLQGAVIFFVSLPILVVIHQPGGGLGILDLLGVLVWLLGFTFEAVGDWQLLHFKQAPANRGRILQAGLWRYSRHPNYFGEAILWWGLLLIALGSPYGIIAVVSPLLIDFLLFKVSGVPMLEAKYVDNPAFQAYKQRTNAIFPWFPGEVEGGEQ